MNNLRPTRWVFILPTVIAALMAFHTAKAATFFSSPSSGTYTVGQTVTVTIRENSAGQAINAGEGTIAWTSNTLQFVSISTSGSIFKYWPVDPTVKGSSTIVFSGGLPSPGYSGSSGTILKISFVVKAAGTASVSISNARILANDGMGTNVYTGQSSANYTTVAAAKPTEVTPSAEVPNRPTPVVSSTSFPDQLFWYRDPEVKLTWTKPSGLQGVSYSVTTDASTVPDETIDSTGESTSTTLSTDGTWYFHLRGKYETGWSGIRHFALHLDRKPPESFTPLVVQDRGPSDPTPVLTFTTTDSLSGVAKYTYSVDGGKGIEASSPADLSGLSAGKHAMTVSAYDQAGNVREGKATITIEGYAAPVLTYVSTPLLLLDPLIIRGTANIGDTITIYANDQSIGQAVAGSGEASAAPGVKLRVPWSFTTDKIFRPGSFVVTVTATSADGLVSVTTDPWTVRVNGKSLTFNGRPIATLSIVTPLLVLIIVLLLMTSAVMAKVVLVLVKLHRRQDEVEEELETLRDANKRQPISRQQLDSALTQIEDDLDGASSTPRPSSRRRSKKRTR